MYRIISEVRPRYAIIENVPMLIHRGIERVLCDLTEIGMHCEWQIVGADEVGAWHRRKRIWIVAYFPNSNNSRHMDRQTKKQPTEGRLDAFSKSEPSSTHERDVSNTNIGDAQARCERSRGVRKESTRKRSSSKSSSIDKIRESSEQYWNTQQRLGRMANGISNRLDRSYWAREPEGIPRVTTGQKNRVSRLKGLGNAVCPQVVYEIMRRIK